MSEYLLNLVRRAVGFAPAPIVAPRPARMSFPEVEQLQDVEAPPAESPGNETSRGGVQLEHAVPSGPPAASMPGRGPSEPPMAVADPALPAALPAVLAAEALPPAAPFWQPRPDVVFAPSPDRDSMRGAAVPVEAARALAPPARHSSAPPARPHGLEPPHALPPTGTVIRASEAGIPPRPRTPRAPPPPADERPRPHSSSTAEAALPPRSERPVSPARATPSREPPVVPWTLIEPAHANAFTPSVPSAASQPSEPPPVEVHIGTIEIRATTPPAPPAPRPAAKGEGFDAYRRVRTYADGDPD